MTLEESISNLHSQFQLFSSQDFDKDLSILKVLSTLPEYAYLFEFYKVYKDYFGIIKDTQAVSRYSTNRDLPFIGKNALEKQEVKFIFYFEGSLAEEAKLSITVLSHLWLTTEEDIINKFCGKGKWWYENNYRFIKDNLNISNEVIQNSYITDSVRFSDKNGKSDDEKNRKFIKQEILLLKPKLVICVGTKAKDLVGMKYYDQNTKFHYVPFPSFQFKSKVEGYKSKYEELNSVLISLN
ncbi:hypothetical protein GCM10011514_35720 [Emticicia aquatilis]|uniref:Uracil-DNA glycosylase-like domain-containing protein n=1 Tax=Emticicia aquatilis TaxID=1537369 RepID=A0A916YZF1_9BACT|nr:uracil-DNA glycosylase family protein [Emticicia aquatilis]GGD68468.1 hypothetical protein GCM10011514_35720 [Emticicia aquatilis]